MTELQNLMKLRDEAKDAYYNDGEGIMSDADYDALCEKILKLDPDAKEKVGAQVKGKSTCKHDTPMLSMGKSKTPEEAMEWAVKIGDPDGGYHIAPKIDGLSCDLIYYSGMLIRVSTRGDGKTGQDITAIASHIDTIPKVIETTGTVHVRGELHLPKSTKFDTKGKPLRNNAVGLVNRKEGKEDCKYLKFIAYQVFGGNLLFEKEEDKFGFLTQQKFYTPEYFVVKSKTQFESMYNLYLKKLRNAWDYETDGLVITVNDTKLHEGINSKWNVDHHYHHNLALKGSQVGGESEVVDIEWNVSRLGNVIPTIIIKPIFLLGREIKRASLSNYENVIKMKIEKGDVIRVIIANDVIPYIEKNITKGINQKNGI